MRLLALVGAVAIVVALAAVVFFFGGYYSVAGTAPEPGIVKWALVKVRTASIQRHAADTPPGPFDDAAVQAGARAFLARGCANCHGAPGVEWQKFSEGLRPDPPDLKDIVKDVPASQLHWVVANGINMTGMPSFTLAGVPDDEIWKIVAFLKKLPEVSDADFKSWTASADAPRPPADIPPPPPPAAAPQPTAPAPPPAPDNAPRPNQ
jgi:mono/diheme cytochrome c family protein